MDKKIIAKVMGLYLADKIDKRNVPTEISEVADTLNENGIENIWQFVLDESEKLCNTFNKK